jgi:transposase
MYIWFQTLLYRNKEGGTAMAFISQRPKLKLSQSEISELSKIHRSRTEGLSRVQRAGMLLSIAKQFKTNRPKIERTIDRALQLGAIPSLDDLPRKGKPTTIPAEAKVWVLSLACQKPKDLGYAAETWTMASLATHIRSHCQQVGYPSLSKISKGTVSKLLSKAEVRPHKIKYYVERRDPDFHAKMVQVLHVYKEVELLKANSDSAGEQTVAILSYDEKPGIQATGNTSPDLPPVPGRHRSITRDYEYRRLGTVSLLASMDLISGHVHGQVHDRHRSREFIEHLENLDSFYPKDFKIKIILDNHSSHISKETKAYLKTVPNRFEFIFTPTHGSWLNMIETFFSKMTRSFLRGIRVDSINELMQRIQLYLDEINQTPVIFKWKYKLDEINTVTKAA